MKMWGTTPEHRIPDRRDCDEWFDGLAGLEIGAPNISSALDDWD
jgi:hypothetical protein